MDDHRTFDVRKSAVDVLIRAWTEHPARKTFALFSGGNDSAVLAHWAQPYVDALVHIDTGTALPGVREFVERFAARYEMPLLVYESGDAYERLILDTPANADRPFGFPGPGQHPRAYQRLKERQIEALVRDHKEGRSDRIMLLTGVRRAESQRRMGWGDPVNRKGAQVWVNPLIDWSDQDMRDYRVKFGLPQSDVAALACMSGECTCGSFSRPQEREFLSALFPEWGERIADLERRAEAAGAINCRWGTRPPPSVHPDQETLDVAPGPMCVGCAEEAA